MPQLRYQHTIQVPEPLERAWRDYCATRQEPESFNAFVLRLMRQEMDLLCVTRP